MVVVHLYEAPKSAPSPSQALLDRRRDSEARLRCFDVLVLRTDLLMCF